MTYIYFQNDDNPRHIVRHKKGRGILEHYLRGVGWTEDPDLMGILTGEMPYFTQIDENKAMIIIKNIEAIRSEKEN